jgi:hypothetical protein
MRAIVRTNLLEGDVERLQGARRQAFLLAEQPEEDVLRADVVVLESVGFVLGDDDGLPGAFGEALEHGTSLAARYAALMSMILCFVPVRKSFR